MDTIKTLNDLLLRNHDAEKGFQLAFEKTENETLKHYFLTNSKMHKEFSFELRKEIIGLGGDVSEGTSLTGDLHRTWLNVKSALTGQTEKAIIEECERGQQTAMDDYQDAVDNIGIPRLANVLAKHKARIVDVVHELKMLDLVH